MEKKISTEFDKGDIVTYDIAYTERENLEINNPRVKARYIQEINDDGLILLDGFFTAIPSEYVMPIPIDSEIAKQARYNEIKSPYHKEDVYSIPPFMDTLAKHPNFDQLQTANLKYVHEVQHWLGQHNMRTLEVNVFYGMRHPLYI